ncbi:MAG: M20 family metallopeptidase [Lachnospiraceae bacterium]|nr:M20 family metallopeptidase [Lachnospiraceae bacterium]
MDVRKLANDIYEEMVAWRRELHQKPELSFEEYQTAGFIYNKLQEFGLDRIEYVCDTAVVAILNGGKGNGKCMAIRADIDALPVTEQTGYEFASKRDGVMHACAHDGHTAILLATAKIMAEQREEFKGCIKFIFEHGEEKFPGGAKALVHAGVMENPHVDAIIGLHIVPTEECGKIRIKSGPVAIGCDVVNVDITGKSGHAARPHEAHDALLAACQYVIALQQIVSRNIDPKNTEIISVGTLNAGTAVNIIADHARLSMNARSYDIASRDITKKKLYDIANGIGTITDCTFDVEYVDGYEPTINDEKTVNLVLDACRKHMGEDSIEIGEYDLGSDDFSYYMNATNTPGAYFFLLSGYEGKERYVNHHPCFTWKEEAMKTGVGAYLSVLMEYLQ